MTGPGDGKWLSRNAVLWALDEAPDVPARLVSTLIAIARYAAEDGTGAYPSSSAIAMATRKSPSQAARDMLELARLGLLRPGDPRLAKDIRADRRPHVYDLPMPERVASRREPSGKPRVASRRKSSTVSRVASGNRTTRMRGQNDSHLDANEEGLKSARITSAARARTSGARAVRSETPKSKPGSDETNPCDRCGHSLAHHRDLYLPDGGRACFCRCTGDKPEEPSVVCIGGGAIASHPVFRTLAAGMAMEGPEGDAIRAGRWQCHRCKESARVQAELRRQERPALPASAVEASAAIGEILAASPGIITPPAERTDR